MNWRTIGPTRQFWAILFVGYCMGGLTAMLIFLETMLAVVFLGIIAILLIPKDRSDAVNSDLLNKDCWLIKFFCRRGDHTWGVVEIQEPESLLARSILGCGADEQRIGKSHCVGCGKELYLQSFINMNEGNKGKPYWSVLSSKNVLIWIMAQDKR